MEHLLSVWPKIAAQLSSTGHILLLCDYDGTLCPIVDRPELAGLPDDTRRLLQALARQRGLTLGIISGRALADLKGRVGIDGIIYAGNHGLEIEGPGISFVNPAAAELKPILSVMRSMLSRALGAIRGVFVEDKGLSLSVHYRLAEEHTAGDIRGILKRAVDGAEAKGKARITSGKKVYEVRPAVKWDKGKAIKLVIEQYGRGNESLLPLYMGDDLTDEDGFRFVNGYGPGISVLVGEPERKSSARYFLKSPAEVATFLSMLLAQGQKDLE